MHPTDWLISTQVVAHAGVRWWAGRGKCDETNTLAKDRLFTINDEDFPQKACQLAALAPSNGEEPTSPRHRAGVASNAP